MSSKQIKIEKGLHQEVKEFVDNTDRYSSYKSFYEDAVRRRLDQEKQQLSSSQKEEIKEFVKELKK